jgi:hypothetical protein
MKLCSSFLKNTHLKGLICLQQLCLCFGIKQEWVVAKIYPSFLEQGMKYVTLHCTTVILRTITIVHC